MKNIFVDNQISACFDTILDFLTSGEAPVASYPIVVSHSSLVRPPEYILFNSEQMTRDSQLKLLLSTATLPNCKAVWDYSAMNVRILAEHGISARHVPLQSSREYRARLQSYRLATGLLYDFGFCGSLSPRRLAVLEALRAAGKTVQVVQCHGEARDRLLAASRIHLNIHYSDDYRVFESSRCNPWLDIGVPVVSEASLDDDPRCHVVSYESMVHFCLDLARDLQLGTPPCVRPEALFRGGSYEMEQRYLDLLESCLLDDIYGSQDLTSGRPATQDEVNQGLIWPARAHTMVGRARLRNIRACLCDVLEKGIEGDVIETGVWRGGSVIYMKAILTARGSEKKVYVADSFRGLPPPDERYPADNGDQHHTHEALAVAKSTVEENFRRYRLLDDSVRFVEGFFEESLPTAGIDKLCLLRLDGDMYSSTIQVLHVLYDKLQKGGYVIVDDYGLSGCKQAVDDFRRARGITDPLLQIDWTGHYWQKTA